MNSSDDRQPTTSLLKMNDKQNNNICYPKLPHVNSKKNKEQCIHFIHNETSNSKGASTDEEDEAKTLGKALKI